MRTRDLSSNRRPSLLALGSALALVGGLLAVVGQVATAPAAHAEGYRVYSDITSEAGLGRIRTAPDGNMWFVLEDLNRVGRITPAGVITEFDLPSQTVDSSSAKDLAIAPDGTAWVVYDSGWHAFAFDTATASGLVDVSLGDSPYGEEVTIGPGGIPFISMSYDDDGLARVVNGQSIWYDGAPPCDGAVATARDGAVWCQADDAIVRSKPDASGGTQYPLPDDLPDPYSLAAGPVGSMWFARFFEGTWVSAPDSGDVGYIDQRSGATKIFDTGDDTAPFSLAMGPDKNMWFTSIGDAEGIGHLDSRGRGALTKIGNYSPRYLTFAKDGAVWFTDSENNSIVRVPRSMLQRTNVDPGEGSVFLTKPLGTLAVGGKPLNVARNKVPLRIACPKGGATCRGTAVLQHPRKAQAWTAKKTYAVKPGKKVTLKLALTKAGKKALRTKPVKARATLSGDGTRTSKPVKVRR